MTTSFNLEEDMRPLFEQAEREHKWLYCSYQSVWFSPRELREEQSKGHFRWAAVNWEVRDPKEHIRELDLRVLNTQLERQSFLERVLVEGGWQTQ